MHTPAGYQLTDPLYQGRRSILYRGTRLSDGRPVILKFLNPAYSSLGHQRLRREYELTRSLSESLVVRPLALEEGGREPVLVLEDEGGVSLASQLCGPLPLSEFLPLALGMTRALAEVHRQGLLHKDVKPANFVWYAPSGRVRLTDFGFAVLLPRTQHTLANTRQLEGSLPYLSPEQTGRMNRGLDWRSDLYSLGVCFYEMLAGQRPFSARDTLGWVHAHIARVPPPLQQCAAQVPKVLADMVMRLLAKAAEERYQTAAGLEADLLECLHRLESTGRCEPFPLGRQDVSDRFQVPQKLYGREEERARYLEAFERAMGGDRCMLLISGQGGIGKSALVQELYRPLVHKHGYFASGKFDLLQRTTPYAALVGALQGLLRQLLSESADTLARWRRALLQALGVHAQALIELVPEIELITGAQPPAPQVGPAEALRRFHLLLQKFIGVFCQPEHPLVLFLDDLQWADSESLALLQVLLGDEDTRHFFFIGAYRDSEVDEAHPLSAALQGLKARGAALSHISLGPLSQESMERLLGETLRASADAVRPLARLLLQKTGGNPFFTHQLLYALHAEGLITWQEQTRTWQWELAAISAKGVTDNVIALTVARLRQLSEATRKAVCLAACVGSHFELGTLAIICEADLESTGRWLEPAVREGLLVEEGLDAAEELREDALARRPYRFIHDRVQQAALELIEGPERAGVHLRIGRLLQSSSAQGERLFEIVDHLSQGRERMVDPEERLALARLCLEAGLRAERATAYGAMREYLNTGVALLPEDRWESQPQLAFALYREQAEAEFYNGRYDAAEQIIQSTLPRVRTGLERGQLASMHCMLATLKGRMHEAVAIGCRVLSELGMPLPEEGFDEVFLEENARIQELLKGRTIASLVEAPELTDPRLRLATQVLSNLLHGVRMVEPKLHPVLVTRLVMLCLEHGATPESAGAFSNYGMLCGSLFADYQRAYEYGMLALALCQRFAVPNEESKACLTVAVSINPWRLHLRETERIAERGFTQGRDSGELHYASLSASTRLRTSFLRGVELGSVLAELPRFASFVAKAGHPLSSGAIAGIKCILTCLAGETHPLGAFVVEGQRSEVEYLDWCRSHYPPTLYHYLTLKAQVLYLFGRYAEAHSLILQSKASEHSCFGFFIVAENAFWHALILMALGKDGEELANNLARFEPWAANAPDNFTHKKTLLAAERARLSGRFDEAASLYDEAASQAHRVGFIHHAALANELAARFWLRRGRTRVGADYLQEALAGYQRWGAQAKVALLQAEFPELKTASLMSAEESTSSSRETSSLDMEALLKATHIISREIVLERLLSNLLTVLMENAGARGGRLFLDRQGELMLAAKGGGEPLSCQTVPLVPLAEVAGDVFGSVVLFVQRSQESLLLEDALTSTYGEDPYVSRHQPRSVLCVPILGKGRLSAIIYLENPLTTGAFHPGNLESLRILAAQAAISMENAFLYENLERLVEERSRALKEAQRQLVETAHRAGMAEVAGEVLHTVGNVLTSVKTSAWNAENQLQALSVQQLRSIATLLAENAGNQEAFLSSERGQLLPPYLQALATRYEEQRGECLQELGRLQQNIDKISTLITRQQQHARQPGWVEPVELGELMGEVLALHEAALARRGIEVRRELESVPALELNRYRLQQVLVTLVDNARRALEEAPTQPRVLTVRLVRADAGGPRIEVSDNGLGISTEGLTHIFRQGYSTWEGGHGLGLHYAANMLKEMGGTLSVWSAGPGLGATFTLELPSPTCREG